MSTQPKIGLFLLALNVIDVKGQDNIHVLYVEHMTPIYTFVVIDLIALMGETHDNG